MESDQLHVPAFFRHSKGPSSEPQTQWFYFFTVATICVFEKFYKGIYFRSNCLGWFACYRTQFLTDLFKDPFLSSVCVCVCCSFIFPPLHELPFTFKNVVLILMNVAPQVWYTVQTSGKNKPINMNHGFFLHQSPIFPNPQGSQGTYGTQYGAVWGNVPGESALWHLQGQVDAVLPTPGPFLSAQRLGRWDTW